MTTLRIDGTLIAATDDVLTYRLLPYGEPGRTSLGKITASKGSVTVPDDLVAKAFANLDHDRTKPAAKFVSVTEDDGGLVATFRPLDNTHGRDLRIEAAEGVRTGVSVEVENPVIRDGALLGGVLDGAGFTSSPAFPGAQLVAADTGDLPDWMADRVSESISVEEVTHEGKTYVQTTTSTYKTTTVPKDGEDTETVEETEKEGEDMPETQTVTATENLTASAPVGIPLGNVNKAPKDANDVFERLNAALTAEGVTSGQVWSPRLLASVDQIIYSDVSPVSGQGSWLGEVWTQREYVDRYAGVFNRQNLTGLKMTGWRFDKNGSSPYQDYTPTVASYDGYGNEPASTLVKTKAVSVAAIRFAGYNEYDRAVDDFPGDFPGFWEGFFREQARSVAQQIDAASLAHMVTSGNYVAVAATDLPTTPAQDLATVYAILDGVEAIQDRAIPDFVIIPAAQWKGLLAQRNDDKFANLDLAFNVDPATARLAGKIAVIPSSNATFTAGAGNGGKVLVGSSTQHTLWGEKTVRAQTVNIANGGNTVGLFGYAAFLTRDPDSFALVTIENDAS